MAPGSEAQQASGITRRRYRVTHETVYRYEAPVTLSYQQLHLTPRPLAWQSVEHHAIMVAPGPTHRTDRTDAFGNPMVEVVLQGSHDQLEVHADSIVTVCSRPQARADTSLAWEAVREHLAYRAGWRPDAAMLAATQYLYESPYVRVKRELAVWAQQCFGAGEPVIAGACRLMRRIHEEFAFDRGATTVSTPVMTVFRERRGVCQDFAHFMISCLRSLGLAARYISGYLLTTPPPGKERLIGADASHAWVGLHVPGAGWIELDPTNGLLPGDEHITLGWGRDFSDVTPLRGVIHGGGRDQALQVAVTVRPDAAADSSAAGAPA